MDFKKAFDEYRKNSAVTPKKADTANEPQKYVFTDFITGQPLIKETKKEDSVKEKKNYTKAAKLLLLLGKDQSAKILSHFSDKEIEEITKEIMQIKQIDKNEAASLLSEFGEAGKKTDVFTGGVETARAILTKAFGKEKAEKLLKESLPESREAPFEFLADLEPKQIFFALKNEVPSVISIVMGYLDSEKNAELLKEFPENMQKDIILKMAGSRRIGKEVITKIEEKIKEKVRLQGNVVTTPIDGKNKLANILKFMDLDKEEDILHELSEEDENLASDIRQSIYTIDIIKNIPDADFQKVLKNFSDKDIALILKGQPPEIKTKFFNCMSQQRGTIIQEESAYLGIMRKSDIIKYVREFVEYIRQAEKDGEIVIDRGDLIF